MIMKIICLLLVFRNQNHILLHLMIIIIMPPQRVKIGALYVLQNCVTEAHITHREDQLYYCISSKDKGRGCERSYRSDIKRIVTRNKTKTSK